MHPRVAIVPTPFHDVVTQAEEARLRLASCASDFVKSAHLFYDVAVTAVQAGVRVDLTCDVPTFDGVWTPWDRPPPPWKALENLS